MIYVHIDIYTTVLYTSFISSYCTNLIFGPLNFSAKTKLRAKLEIELVCRGKLYGICIELTLQSVVYL